MGFQCPYVTRSLYCSLVRPIVEYASPVWSPFFEVNINRIESIQRRFLVFALRGLGWADRFNLSTNEARLLLLGLDTLVDRGYIATCSLVAFCLKCKILADDLCEHLEFRTLQREIRSAAIRRLNNKPTPQSSYEKKNEN